MSEATILLVRERDLPQLPRGVHAFVMDYFVGSKVLGVSCRVAVIVERPARDPKNSGAFVKRTGVAPGCACDVREYRVGFEEADLFAWIKAHDGDLVTQLVASSDDTTERAFVGAYNLPRVHR